MRYYFLYTFVLFAFTHSCFPQNKNSKNFIPEKDYSTYYNHLNEFYDSTNVVKRQVKMVYDTLKYRSYAEAMDSLYNIKSIDSLINFVEPRYIKDVEYLNGYNIPPFSGLTFDGNLVKADYKKMTLLYFWNLTSQSCLDQIPYLNKLQEKYSEKLDIISLCNNNYEEFFHFHNTNKVKFTIICDSNKITQDILKLKGMNSKCILIDNTGKVKLMTMYTNYKKMEDEYQKLEEIIKN
jgi:thiol-disulfide isomerase/thioredoxin